MAEGSCFSQAELLAFCQGGDATISEAFGWVGKVEDLVFKPGGQGARRPAQKLTRVLGGFAFLVLGPDVHRGSGDQNAH